MIDHRERVSNAMHALCIMKVRVTNRYFIPPNECHCMSAVAGCTHAGGKLTCPLRGIWKLRDNTGTLQGQCKYFPLRHHLPERQWSLPYQRPTFRGIILSASCHSLQSFWYPFFVAMVMFPSFTNLEVRVTYLLAKQ